MSAYNADPVYLRQVDVPGVDTKFLETNRSLLSDLLTEVLAPARIDETAIRTDLAARFGFRRKPDYVRFRTLDPSRPLPGGFLEVMARVDAVAGLGALAPRVLVVENEITYLALPDSVAAIAVLGSGFGLGRLARIDWLHEVELSEPELRLYADLRADTFGPSVRLEQERIGFHLISQAL